MTDGGGGMTLNVAAPWALSHYVPFNGYNPLYRALFDEGLQGVALHGWDNNAIFAALTGDKTLRTLFREAVRAMQRSRAFGAHAEQRRGLWPPNELMTALLPGDVELHHSAPFPSMTRPFVLHCESFETVFHPLFARGTRNHGERSSLRESLHAVLGSPLCLGVFSHIPETIGQLRDYVDDEAISRKIFSCRIGLSRSQLAGAGANAVKKSLEAPSFLFLGSTGYGVDGFFSGGGSVALRFWQQWIGRGGGGRLVLCCQQPSSDQLLQRGVDPAFVQQQSNRSIFWIGGHLGDIEVNRLCEAAHFLLLPGATLQSVSAMRALACGAIPVVSDVVGIGRYVRDGANGIVLKGVRDAVDATPETFVEKADPMLEADLADQIVARIGPLVSEEPAYHRMSKSARSSFASEFTGKAFSADLLSRTRELYFSCEAKSDRSNIAVFLRGEMADRLNACALNAEGVDRAFDSPNQPSLCLWTGIASVFNFGGSFWCVRGQPKLQSDDWSSLAAAFNSRPIQIAPSIEEFRGRYLMPGAQLRRRRHQVIEMLKRALAPYPTLYVGGARLLRLMRRSFPSLIATTLHDDVELKQENVLGYNIVKCAGAFYAIRQADGSFSLERYKANGYSSAYKGPTLANVRKQIEDTADNHPYQIELVEEGIREHNILRCFNSVQVIYLAVRQSDGAFDIERIRGDEGSQYLKGASHQEVRDTLLSRMES